MEELMEEARRAGADNEMVDVTRVKRQAAWGHRELKRVLRRRKLLHSTLYSGAERRLFSKPSSDQKRALFL